MKRERYDELAFTILRNWFKALFFFEQIIKERVDVAQPHF